MTAVQRIVGALYVDMESSPPRARYECLLCHAREGPVIGRGKVTAFVANVRINHRAACPGQTDQGAQAA